MRYTTIIDLSEFPAVYRNKNVRLVYLHLVFKSGYHDNDRDLIDISIRNLAWAVGLSVSATRHALYTLEHARMIKRSGALWHVRKFIVEQEITPRAKSQKEAKKKAAAVAEQQASQALDNELEVRRKRQQWLRDNNLSEFIIYYEDVVRRANAGDVDAQETARKRKDMYIADCKACGHMPIQI